MKKRFLTIVTVIALMLTMMSTMAFAEDGGYRNLEELYNETVKAGICDINYYLADKDMSVFAYLKNNSDNNLYVDIKGEPVDIDEQFYRDALEVEPGAKATFDLGISAGDYCMLVANPNETAAEYEFFIMKGLKTPAKPTVKSTKKKTLKVSWKPVSGATEYFVYYKLGNKEYKKKVKGTSVTLKKLKSGEKYKVRVQAKRSVNGLYVMSDESNYSKAVKVK